MTELNKRLIDLFDFFAHLCFINLKLNVESPEEDPKIKVK
jgi:hypothetical protein